MRDARGEKLSKSNGAAPIEVLDPLAALRDTAVVLNLTVPDSGDIGSWLQRAVASWRIRWLQGA